MIRKLFIIFAISLSCTLAFSQIKRIDKGGKEFSKLSILGVDYFRVTQQEDGGYLFMFLHDANENMLDWGFFQVNTAADFDDLYAYFEEGFTRDKTIHTPIILEINNNIVELQFGNGIDAKSVIIFVSDKNNRLFSKRSSSLSFKQIKKVFKKNH